MIEKNPLDVTDQDIIRLSAHKRKETHSEAEIMANIIRDPILIGVTR